MNREPSFKPRGTPEEFHEMKERVARVTANLGIYSFTDTFSLTEVRAKILDTIRANGPITMRQIAQRLQFPRFYIQQECASLNAAGLITRANKGGPTSWRIK